MKGGGGRVVKRGRPTKYKEEYAKQAYKLCLLGATDADLANFFEVDEATINRWKQDHEEFCESLKNGKEVADANVANRLYQRAIGYEHEEDKIFQYEGKPVVVPTVKHYPPDPTAAIFWLKNRQKDKWRDKQEHELTGKDGGPVEIQRTDLSKLTDEELAAVEKILAKAKKE